MASTRRPQAVRSFAGAIDSRLSTCSTGSLPDRRVPVRVMGGLWLALTAVGACGNSPAGFVGGDGAETVTRPVALRLDPAAVSMDAIPDTARVRALVVLSSGATREASSVNWSVSHDSVAEVSPAGLVRSLANGTTRLIAWSEGLSSEVPLVVDQAADTVLVSPRRSPVSEGTAIALSARAVDRLGTQVPPDVHLQWSSLDPQIAIVESPGVVRGVAEGTAVIEVRAGEAVGSAVVDVVPFRAPNEPGGYTMFTEQPWDALETHGWRHKNRQSQSVITTDATSPGTPSNVLEMQYPAGYTGGSEPAVEFINLQNRSEVYVSFWFKANAGWQGHSTGTNKLVFFFDGSGLVDNLFFGMIGRPGGPYEFTMYPQHHTEQYLRETEQGIPAWLRPNLGTGLTVEPGRWHRVEIQLIHHEGTLRWWQDGVLIAEHTGLALDGSGFGEFQIAPTWGGGGDVKQNDDYFRFDDFYISRGSR